MTRLALAALTLCLTSPALAQTAPILEQLAQAQQGRGRR